jgi:hypothetical protein
MDPAKINDQVWNEHRATFEKRGVSREVAERRPYVRYEKGERATTDELFSSIPPRQRGATVTRRVNYSGGWLMIRHAIMPGLGPVLPEFGPADKLEAHTRRHDHTWPPRFVNHILGRGHGGENVNGMHEHDWIDRPHRHDSVDPSTWKRHVDGKRSSHRDERDKALDPSFGLHPHARTKKYLFAPKPWSFRPYMKLDHSHGRKSLAKWHADGGAEFAHQHIEYAKVSESFARRLDMHPDSVGRLAGARRVFFSIEGVLKNDALVTAGEVAFNVPSVWQTDAPELEDFARTFLTGKTVYIVPDSDWAENPEVALAAFTARETLRRILGPSKVLIAAPTPEPTDCELHGAKAGEKRGVDDYIADVGSVADLTVIDRRTSPQLHRWMHPYRVTARAGTYANGRDRNTVVLEGLTMLADEHGRVTRRERSIARFLGWHNPRAFEKVQQAINALIDIDGPDVLQKDPDAPDFDFASGPFEEVDTSIDTGGIETTWRREWLAAPVITIRRDLRAVRESTYLEK